MIWMVQPLPAGNALRLFIEPPAGAARWKLLRKASDSFAGHDDQTAAVVYEGDETVVLDTLALVNDVPAFYRPYYYTADGALWAAGATASGTPAARYRDDTTDVLWFLRERLEAGLKVEVERGNFSTNSGYVRVFAASPTLERDFEFPLVTVHLESEEPSVRAIGEAIGVDVFDGVGDEWVESEGWLASVRVTIVGWTMNSDERIELRKAIRRIIVANLPVFDAKGFQQVDLSQQDVDLVEGTEYPGHIFQVLNNFTCLAPVVVSADVEPIRDVISRRTNEQVHDHDEATG